MSLKGKVAIVTGNSGIGLSIVLELAKQGASIVIDYVAHPEATEALEKQVAALGDQIIGVKADVSKVAELRTLIDTAVQRFGRLDIMVNNAGVETRTSVLDTTEEQYEKVLSINLKSAFFGTQLAARQMIKQGDGGCIINITSVHEDGRCLTTPPTACPRAECMLTRTRCRTRASQHTRHWRGTRRCGDSYQYRHDERSRGAEETQQCHPARAHGQAGRDWQRGRLRC